MLDPECYARRTQGGDEMYCAQCRLRWSADDPEPPDCPGRQSVQTVADSPQRMWFVVCPGKIGLYKTAWTISYDHVRQEAPFIVDGPRASDHAIWFEKTLTAAKRRIIENVEAQELRQKELKEMGL